MRTALRAVFKLLRPVCGIYLSTLLVGAVTLAVLAAIILPGEVWAYYTKTSRYGEAAIALHGWPWLFEVRADPRTELFTVHFPREPGDNNPPWLQPIGQSLTTGTIVEFHPWMLAADMLVLLGTPLAVAGIWNRLRKSLGERQFTLRGIFLTVAGIAALLGWIMYEVRLLQQDRATGNELAEEFKHDYYIYHGHFEPAWVRRLVGEHGPAVPLTVARVVAVDGDQDPAWRSPIRRFDRNHVRSLVYLQALNDLDIAVEPTVKGSDFHGISRVLEKIKITTPCDAAALAFLCGPEVRELQIVVEHITNGDLRFLLQSPKLNDLRLVGVRPSQGGYVTTPLDNGSLDEILRLPKLRDLYLSGSGVDGKALERFQQHLTLDYVDLSSTLVTEDDARQFAERHPEWQVRHDTALFEKDSVRALNIARRKRKHN